jgi:hypothetical protein
MLHEFLTANRTALITRCRNKVALRFAPSGTPAALEHGVPIFLQQLVETLRREQRPSGNTVAPGATPAVTEISRAAGIHGAELLRLGYSIDQVVRDFGDVCQAITELASELDTEISVEELRAIADRTLPEIRLAHLSSSPVAPP